MGFNDKEFRSYTFSPHLALASVFAGALSEHRGHVAVEVPDYLASCYIADPIRFLAFWEDSLGCLYALRLECELIDPVLSYQWNLTEQIKTKAAGIDCWTHKRAQDLDACFLAASKLESVGSALPEIDLPHFLIAVSNDVRFGKLFSAGFCKDLALKWIRRAPPT